MNIFAGRTLEAQNAGMAIAVRRNGAEEVGPHDIGPCVRARAPLRLGLAGGGTDLSPYCDEYGGAILNVTIARYAHTHLAPRNDGKVCFSAHDVNQQDILPVTDEDLPVDTGLLLHRAVYNRVAREFLGGRYPALTVTSAVDAPAGSGLGASSALVVALVDAFRAAFALPLGRYDVARLAFDIERVDLGLAGGRQDHYAAAFGGVNFMEFLPEDRVIVNPLRVAGPYLRELEASLVVCFTGEARASAIIQDQMRSVIRSNQGTLDAMHQLKRDAVEMKQAMLRGDIGGIAEVLDRSWQAKRRTSHLVSNSAVEGVMELGLRNGAVSGKVSGAGGGGFLMFMTDPEHRYQLIAALGRAGLSASAVQFTDGGVEAWVAGR